MPQELKNLLDRPNHTVFQKDPKKPAYFPDNPPQTKRKRLASQVIVLFLVKYGKWFFKDGITC